MDLSIPMPTTTTTTTTQLAARHQGAAPSSPRQVQWAVWAGLVTPVPVVATGVIIATVGENLRQYGMPWLLAAGALLVRWCLAGPYHLGAPNAGRLERVGHVLVSAGLLGVAAFFAGLAVEDLLDTTLGSGRFLSDNTALSPLLTLLGSTLSLVVLPVGLVLYGIAVATARRLPDWTRWLPLAIPVIIVAGATAASLTGLPFISTAWAALVALACARLALSVKASPTPKALSTNTALDRELITTPTNLS